MTSRWAIALWAAMMVAALCFLYFVRAILFPFVASLFLAMLLNPWIGALQRRYKYSRARAISFVYLVFLAIVVTLPIALWPHVRTQAEQLTIQLPAAIQNAQASLRSYLIHHPRLVRQYKIVVPIPSEPPRYGPSELPLARTPEPKTRLETDTEVVDRLMSQYFGQLSVRFQEIGPALLGDVLAGGAAALSKLLNMVLIPIITFFLLIDLERFRRQGVRLIPKPFRRPVVDTLEDIGDVFISYIRGLVTAAGFYAALACIEYTILGLPYALVLGLLAGLLYFIPYLGPLITVSLIAAAAAISASPHMVFFTVAIESPVTYTLFVTITALVVYFIFDQLVTPRVVGGAVGLHPVFSFFAIMSGATLFGIPGMLLAYPVAGSIKVILGKMLPLMQLDEDPPVQARSTTEPAR